MAGGCDGMGETVGCGCVDSPPSVRVAFLLSLKDVLFSTTSQALRLHRYHDQNPISLLIFSPRLTLDFYSLCANNSLRASKSITALFGYGWIFMSNKCHHRHSDTDTMR